MLITSINQRFPYLSSERKTAQNFGNHEGIKRRELSHEQFPQILSIMFTYIFLNIFFHNIISKNSNYSYVIVIFLPYEISAKSVIRLNPKITEGTLRERKCQNARLPVKERRFSAALGSTLFWQI